MFSVYLKNEDFFFFFGKFVENENKMKIDLQWQKL